ncbi:DNA-binding response regulator, OmpR family, contains REC and winged-helix (wHTH) domain [Eubacterium ruminantium]|uniref:Stage 0 sporulation protein A homolog n=1 Tax=Eubacterium ruminantium TaxID=42322 RepID=A0A1T4KJV3_9FIRM|nr:MULTISPECIES: response regulator transcription factor [Eubacterium]MCR5367066.1 response regulator transcription factor [Eubacterium sp.]SCW32628.1 DNA-binding response regulator, OmpR family, contains REC and winged-helix (wHTH) domain [Eubacterium ruminantium]SDM28523.1 DNA-binding response regulator, OmpR family, contains REC and winged-helix (wHTH) domain [Eubacterium ruminantium]SJZ42653.1 DNA-binding response regulator, OmpR family, contains REC and winged-helix (wHTH) domain [Eubacter
MYKIYVIEDEKSIRDDLVTFLSNSGYDADALTDFKNAKEEIIKANADLILMDINIPYLNGQMLLAELRKEIDTPIIMVTSKVSEADEVLSMSFGADDYITKPYNPTILLLRISAVLKRYNKNTVSSGTQKYEGLDVNVAKGSLTDGERELILTKNEMIIFEALLEKKGEIVSRDYIMDKLWNNEEYINDNALTVNISRLRSKLADFGIPDAIETRKKQGYVLK